MYLLLILCLHVSFTTMVVWGQQKELVGPWSHYHYQGLVSPEDLTIMADDLRRLALRRYTYLFDSVPNKIRIGPLPYEAGPAVNDSLIAIKLAERQIEQSMATWASQTGGGVDLRCVVKDEVAVIDPPAIFMRTVAATKYAHQRLLDLRARWEKAMEDLHSLTSAMEAYLTGPSKVADLKVWCRAVEADIRRLREMIALERAMGEKRQEVVELRLQSAERLGEHRRQLRLATLEKRLEVARASMEEGLKAERAAIAREDEIVRRADDEVLKIWMETELQKMKRQLETDSLAGTLEIEEKAYYERLNEELVLTQMRTKAEEDRKYARDVLEHAFHTAYQALSFLIDRPHRLLFLLLGIMTVMAGILASQDLVAVLRKLLERRFARPSLVREFGGGRGWKTPRQWTGQVGEGGDFQGIFLDEELERRLTKLAGDLAIAREKRLPLRNVLIHGPSGNGKSLVARRLAELCGLEFALINGSDFGPLGSFAVSDVHSIFTWARSPMRGSIILIEEAETALADRQKQALSEWRSSILNAVLHYTGEQSYRFMLMLVTNRPWDLDRALLDRIDDVIEVPPPTARERLQLATSCFHKYIMGKAQLEPELEQGLPEALASLAEQTQGMSSREVEKLVISFQGACFSSVDCLLTRSMWDEVVRRKVKEKDEKAGVLAGEDIFVGPFMNMAEDPLSPYANVQLRPAASLSLKMSNGVSDSRSSATSSSDDAVRMKKAAAPGKPAGHILRALPSPEDDVAADNKPVALNGE